MNQSRIESLIWGVADLIRDTFERGKYQDVLLPLTILRRLDCVLADKTSKCDFKSLCEDASHLAATPIPPVSGQERIVAFVRQETARLDTLVAEVREAIDRLREFRTALISAAVTGKIDAREEAP